MIYENFRATGAYKTVHGHADLFTMTSLVSSLCVLHGSRLGVHVLSFFQDCALTAGLTPASSESAWRVMADFGPNRLWPIF